MDNRARNIVRTASKGVKNKTAKSWLFNDEAGTWERRAQDCIERTDPKARELGMTDEQQDEEIVIQLQSLAITTVLSQAQKGMASRKAR